MGPSTKKGVGFPSYLFRRPFIEVTIPCITVRGPSCSKDENNGKSKKKHRTNNLFIPFSGVFGHDTSLKPSFANVHLNF